MGPQAAQAKITSEMTLSERADAIEEHMMHELDKIVTKSVFANMTDGHLEMEGGAALMKKYPQIKGPEDIFAPVGTANAYDAMHLIALAIAQAGSTDGDKVRDALEDLKGKYEGLIKTYEHPFSKTEHDALGPTDYIMVRYEGEKIVPTQ